MKRVFSLILLFLLTSCSTLEVSLDRTPTPNLDVAFTVVPPLTTPTLVTLGPLDATLRTATPTFVLITPEPTVTPLFRATEIHSKDYGQQLTLFVGDTFLLFRLPGDNSPLTIDNQNVLQAVSEKNALSVRLQAVGIGLARVSSWIIIPCPNSPVGCQPPLNYTYLSVIVVDH